MSGDEEKDSELSSSIERTQTLTTVLVPALGRINPNSRDGSEVRFSALAPMLAQRGFRFHIVTTPAEQKMMETCGVHAHFHRITDPFDPDKSVLLTYAGRVLKSVNVSGLPQKIDIVYAPSDLFHDLLPALRYKRQNPSSKLVVCLFLIAPHPFRGYTKAHAHGYTLPTFRSIAYYLFQRLALQFWTYDIDLALVLNHDDEAYIHREGILRSSTAVVAMGIDSGAIQRASPRSADYDAIFLGRIQEQKGILDLPIVWRRVTAELPDAKLAIGGGGSKADVAKLRAAIKRQGLEDRIELLGFLGAPEKYEALKAAKLFVYTSRYDSWAVVCCEAMACGLPVVAYDLPAFREWFPEGMIRIPRFSLEKFAVAVIGLLRDSDSRQKLSERARSVASQYDWANVVAKEVGLLKEVLERQ